MGYGRVFYSGAGAGSRAATFAKETGGVTIESTWLGAVLDSITTRKTYPFLAGAWKRLSKRYAEGAKGPVDVFLGKNFNPQGVWKTVEEKALIKNQIPITVHQ